MCFFMTACNKTVVVFLELEAFISILMNNDMYHLYIIGVDVKNDYNVYYY
jgi:hypothetical protein